MNMLSFYVHPSLENLGCYFSHHLEFILYKIHGMRENTFHYSSEIITNVGRSDGIEKSS